MSNISINMKQDMALALSPPGESSPLIVDISKVSWTPKAVSLFAEMFKLANNSLPQNDGEDALISLPTGALRSLLYAELPNLLSTDNYLGLSSFNLYRKKQSLCCLLKQVGNCKDSVFSCIEEWVEVDLTLFIEQNNLPDHFRDEVFGLLDDDTLVDISSESIQLFPWSRSGIGGPTPPSEGYPLSANDIASILEGEEIFPELPPVHRLVGNNNNKAELISVPIDDHQEGRFSLVCEISVETLPGAKAPIVYVNFKKRKWLDSLSDKYTRNRTKNGYLIELEGTRAYNFKLEKTVQSNWKWTPDCAFSALARKFGIKYISTCEKRFEVDANCFIGLAHDYDSEGELQNKIGTGVPEKDRKDAFNIVCEKLSVYGFTRFSDFERIKNPLKAYSSILYLNKLVKDRNKELKESAADSFYLGEALPEQFFDYSNIPTVGSDKKIYLPELINAYLSDVDVAKHIADMTAYIITNSPAEGDVLKRIAQVLFGDRLSIKSIALPDFVHGPRDSLPSKEEKKKHQRKKKRQERWLEFIKTVIPTSNKAVCLIQAPKFYPTESGVKVDDEVNKPAAKLAFAGSSAIPVQYLLPPDRRSNSTSKLEQYVMKAQQALLDLVFGHLGMLPGLAKRAANYHTKKKLPQYLYGINVYAATNETRAKSAEVAVASRVNVSTGLTEVKIGHQLAEFVITDWMPFTKAIQYLTQRCMSTLSLGKKKADRQALFQYFCSEVLDEAERKTPLAYVYIKAEGGRKYWSLLADSGVLQLVNEAKTRWPSLRVVRVREQAPKLIQEKFDNDGIDKTTTTVSMFKVRASDIPVYWSLGEPVQQYTRGLSCYRSLIVSQAHPKTKEVSIKEFAPDIGQAMRPNAAEFVVVSSLPDEDIDKVAQFTGSLRRGVVPARLDTWVKTPSPLFVLNKLEEYLKL